MINPMLVFRAKRAWDKLRPEDRARLEPHLEEANAELAVILNTGAGAPVKSKRELLYLNAALKDDVKTFLKATEVAAARAAGLDLKTPLDENGEFLGFGKFELLDFGWLEAATVWLENFYTPLPPFVACGAAIRVPNTFTLALAADWGTGQWGSETSPSMKIAGHIADMAPEVTVHLGDVYYAGTAGPERSVLVNTWPRGTLASCTLNSNHEMYPAAVPYFTEALAPAAPFAAQQGSSTFLIENDFWVIVGLDTAYAADKSTLYMHGVLAPEQEAMLARVGASGKKVVLLSHHNALCEDGGQDQYTGPLYAAVRKALGSARPALWYWGHVHCGAVYDSAATEGLGCRCIGHGSLPWGKAAALEGSAQVVWHESKPAGDAHNPERVCNGFAMLRFNEGAVTEEMRDENNELSWSSGPSE